MFRLSGKCIRHIFAENTDSFRPIETSSRSHLHDCRYGKWYRGVVEIVRSWFVGFIRPSILYLQGFQNFEGISLVGNLKRLVLGKS
jgi:hypothetical protein